MTIYERIKQRRKELCLSAEDVAVALDVSRATIYRYESAEVEKLPISVLEPLARVLKTTPGYLMGWTDDPDDFSRICEEPDKLIPPITVHEKALVEAYRDHPSMQPAVDRLLGLPLRDGRSSQTDTGMAEYAAQGVAPSAILEMDAATFRAAEEARLQKQADRLMAQRDRLNKTKFRRKK